MIQQQVKVEPKSWQLHSQQQQKQQQQQQQNMKSLSNNFNRMFTHRTRLINEHTIFSSFSIQNTS